MCKAWCLDEAMCKAWCLDHRGMVSGSYRHLDGVRISTKYSTCGQGSALGNSFIKCRHSALMVGGRRNPFTRWRNVVPTSCVLLVIVHPSSINPAVMKKNTRKFRRFFAANFNAYSSYILHSEFSPQISPAKLRQQSSPTNFVSYLHLTNQ